MANSDQTKTNNKLYTTLRYKPRVGVNKDWERKRKEIQHALILCYFKKNEIILHSMCNGQNDFVFAVYCAQFWKVIKQGANPTRVKLPCTACWSLFYNFVL